MNTIGEKRIRTEFNPSKTSSVDVMKHNYASIVNHLQEIEDEENENPSGGGGAVCKEKIRLVEIAQEKAEEAAMWAVKALTA